MTLDHLCKNPGCVNPEHLDIVTLQENILRGEGVGVKNAGKTHCVKGHPLSGENLAIDYLGRRICRACRKEIERRSFSNWYKKQKEKRGGSADGP